jgi:hypothetical protein
MVAAAPANQCSCKPATKVDWSALTPENGVGFAEIQFQASPPLIAGVAPRGMASSNQGTSAAKTEAADDAATRMAIKGPKRAAMDFFMAPRV